jgi:hypothetical protein
MAQSKTLVLVSLGQLVATKVEDSISAFANILKRQNRGWCCGCLSAEKSVKAALWWDESRFGPGTIGQYKEGKIDFDEFHRRMDKQLGISTTHQEFFAAWTAMSVVQEAELCKIQELIILAQKMSFTMSVFSVTNEAQYA